MNSSTQDDVYRDALAEGLAATAQWRRGKAEQYPDDERNLSSAEALERAAAEVRSLDLGHPVLSAFAELDAVAGFPPELLYSLGQAASRFGFDRLPGGVPIPYNLDALLADILREKLEGYHEGLSGLRPSTELIEFAEEWGVEIAYDDESDDLDDADGGANDGAVSIGDFVGRWMQDCVTRVLRNPVPIPDEDLEAAREAVAEVLVGFGMRTVEKLDPAIYAHIREQMELYASYDKLAGKDE